MISKKTFIEVMKSIIECNKKIDELANANPNAVEFIIDYSLQDELITVLEEAMNLYIDPVIGSTISWWVYDTEFGKNSPNIYVKSKKSKKKIVIDTVEKLYDWCVKEGMQNV